MWKSSSADAINRFMKMIVRPRSVLPDSSILSKNKTGLILLLVSLLSIPSAPLHAVIIRGTDTATTSAPADDPGWNAVGTTANGLSCVYIGNGWVLTAAHCRSADSVETATFNGVTYNLVGTSIRLHEPGDSTKPAVDLSLYRISNLPTGLSSLSISSATPTNGSTVVGMGFGHDRQDTLTYWNEVNSSWVEVTGPSSTYSGYKWASTRTKRWGKNQISSSGLTINVGFGNNYVIETTFNQFGGSGNDEFQASEGDSGGGLFYKTSANVWALAGITEAISSYPGQPDGTAVYGNQTYAIDLSYYRDQIVAAVQVFQFSGMLDNPNAAIGTGWQKSQLLANGGFGNLTGYCSIPVDFNGHQFTLDSGANNITYNGSLFGTGDLIVIGSDPNAYSITLSGSDANSYTGTTQLPSGLLVLNKSTGITALSGSQIIISSGAVLRTDASQQIDSSTALNIQGGEFNLNNQIQTIGALSGTSGTIKLGAGILTVNQTANAAFSGQITGTGDLEKIGASDLILNGNNTYTGATSIYSGKLQIGSGGTAGTLGADSVTNDGILAFNRSDNITISNSIYGGGSLQQIGSGTLTLSGSNSYSGTTTVSNGILKLANVSALGSSTQGTIVQNGGTLDLNGLSIGNEPITIIGSGSAGIGALINSNSSTTANLTGSISLTGNATIGGSGSITLSGITNYGTYNLTKNSSNLLTLAGSQIWGNNSSLTTQAGLLFFEQTAGTTTSVGASTPTLNISQGTGVFVDASKNDPFSDDINSSQRVQIINNSSNGLYIVGGSASVAGISGTGSTTISNGSTLTAGYIYQDTLTIGAGSKIIISPIGAQGSSLSSSSGLSDSAMSLSVVPEPATWTMILIGFLCLGLYRFFRKPL